MVFSLLKKNIKYQDPDIIKPPDEPFHTVPNPSDILSPAPENVIKPAAPEEMVPNVEATPKVTSPLKSHTKVLTRSQLFSNLRLRQRVALITFAVVLVTVGGGAYAYYSGIVDFNDFNFWGIGPEKAAEESSPSSNSNTTDAPQASTNSGQPVLDPPNTPISSGAAPASGSSGSTGGNSGSSGSSPAYVPKSYSIGYTKNGCFVSVNMPADNTIKVGDKITFTNNETTPNKKMHLDSDNSQFSDFDSGVKYANESYAYTFTRTGTLIFYNVEWSQCGGSITIK